MRRVNVDRMRRYVRRHRPPLSRPERFARLIDECGLSAVSGPYPCDPGESIPLGCFRRRELQDWQAWHGVAADGELGPQTWALLARGNDDVRDVHIVRGEGYSGMLERVRDPYRRRP